MATLCSDGLRWWVVAHWWVSVTTGCQPKRNTKGVQEKRFTKHAQHHRPGFHINSFWLTVVDSKDFTWHQHFCQQAMRSNWGSVNWKSFFGTRFPSQVSPSQSSHRGGDHLIDWSETEFWQSTFLGQRIQWWISINMFASPQLSEAGVNCANWLLTGSHWESDTFLTWIPAAIDNNTIVVESKISYSLIIVIRESCTGVTERQ